MKIENGQLNALKGKNSPLTIEKRENSLDSKKILTKLLYSGVKYRCPVCGWRIRRFLPLTKFYTENLRNYGFKYKIEQFETLNLASYSCPICGASDRDRLIALFIKEWLKQNCELQNLSIIDFAPSPPLTSYIRREISQLNLSVEYRTADLYMENVDDKVDIMDIRSIYLSDQFDFFICSHVLEHVMDDKKALGELYRILKPGGCGILMTPIHLEVESTDEDPSILDEAEKWRRFGQFDHVRLYSKNDFLFRIKEASFIVQQLGEEYFGKKSFYANGISDKSILYIVKKTGELPNAKV